jgi:hypothetical protein
MGVPNDQVKEHFKFLNTHMRTYVTKLTSKSLKLKSGAVPWLRQLATGLPPHRPRFDPGSVHVGFVVEKVALGQVFL